MTALQSTLVEMAKYPELGARIVSMMLEVIDDSDECDTIARTVLNNIMAEVEETADAE